MNAPLLAIGLSARFENLGRTPGEREADYARNLGTARGQADALSVRVDEAATR